MRHLLPLIVLAVLLATGCATRPVTSPTPGSGAPTAPAALCPAEVSAPSLPEPLPPRGVDSEALYGWLLSTYGEEPAKAFWRWLTVAWPGWARDGWTRLDAARASCAP